MSRSIRKKSSELSETPTVAFIRKQCLIRHRASNNHRRREASGVCIARVHAQESLLEGFECARKWSGPQIHIFSVRFDRGHEPKLVHIKTPQSLAQCESRFSPSVGQFTGLAFQFHQSAKPALMMLFVQELCLHLPDALNVPSCSHRNNSLILAAKGFHFPSPIESIPCCKILVAGSHLHHAACYIAVWPILRDRTSQLLYRRERYRVSGRMRYIYMA